MARKSRTAKPEVAPPLGDIALVWGKNEDGVHILRRRDENAPVETRTVGDTAGAPIPRSFAGFSMEYGGPSYSAEASRPIRAAR